MDIISREENEFIKIEENGANFIFSTAKNGLDFNKNSIDGIANLNKLKSWFDIDGVGYCNQIHSDIINTYDSIIKDGDAIITNIPNVAMGVFTADCVPILLWDSSKKVVAAIHSGWKSTFNNIVGKSIQKLVQEFDCHPENLLAYIGPHNRVCCYEVGEKLVSEFKSQEMFKNKDISESINLDLDKCIRIQLSVAGVREGNIKSLDICTYCAKDIKLHSYRKSNNGYGRMFSFIYFK